MFLSRNKKINVYHVNISFTVLKLGLRGLNLYWRVFMMASVFEVPRKPCFVIMAFPGYLYLYF